MTPVPDDDRLMTVPEVAYLLGVSNKWVYLHAREAKPRIPCVRIGGGVRFRRTAVERFIRQQERA